MHILLLFASFILKIVAITTGPEFLVLDFFKDLYLVDVSCGLHTGFEQMAPINPPSHSKFPNSELVLTDGASVCLLGAAPWKQTQDPELPQFYLQNNHLSLRAPNVSLIHTTHCRRF